MFSKVLFGLLFIGLFAATTKAQTSETGSVLKWEMKSYSQSANIIRNHVVYSVRVGSVVYQIARRSTKTEMSIGQKIQCRLDKNHLFVLNDNGKEVKYDIVGTE